MNLKQLEYFVAIAEERQITAAARRQEPAVSSAFAEYGLARIVCGEPERALKALGEAGYRAKVVKVAAVAVPDHPGGLAELFEALDELDVNIEYCYCFSHRDGAPSERSRALASRRSRRLTSRQASGARRAIGLARRITGPLSL